MSLPTLVCFYLAELTEIRSLQLLTCKKQN